MLYNHPIQLDLVKLASGINPILILPDMLLDVCVAAEQIALVVLNRMHVFSS